MFEQTLNNIDIVLLKEAGCTTELNSTEQIAPILFFKYLNDLANMTADETLAYKFAIQMHRQHQVADDVFRGTVKRFGDQGVMDLTALLGYYDLVSMTLNLADVQPREPIRAALEPPPVPAGK